MKPTRKIRRIRPSADQYTDPVDYAAPATQLSPPLVRHPSDHSTLPCHPSTAFLILFAGLPPYPHQRIIIIDAIMVATQHCQISGIGFPAILPRCQMVYLATACRLPTLRPAAQRTFRRSHKALLQIRETRCTVQVHWPFHGVQQCDKPDLMESHSSPFSPAHTSTVSQG